MLPCCRVMVVSELADVGVGLAAGTVDVWVGVDVFVGVELGV